MRENYLKYAPFLIVIVSLNSLFAGEPATPQTDFTKEIQPLLKMYCHKCHGVEKTKAGVNFVKVKTPDAVAQDPKMWDIALRSLRDKEMPPEKAPQPSDKDRELLARWIETALTASNDPSKLRKDPGRVTARRLSRLEYNNTIRDLLGVDTKPADAFPADGSGGGGFDNNADTLFVPPILMEKMLRATEEILAAAKPEQLMLAGPIVSTPPRARIEQFVAKAYRRQPASAEIDALMTLVDGAQKKGATQEAAFKLAFKAVLCSPKFLYRVEFDQPGSEPKLVNDYELASRLSYFIWSSMPDDELFAAARNNTLQKPEILNAQITRMLADKKAISLSNNFCAQWLDITDFMEHVQPDKRMFPLSPSLRTAMFEETMWFFDSVLRGGTLTDLLDCDYTFLNEELAKHYGIKDVTGPNMRRVALTDKTRGGLLCMASILTKNSYPRRTSPVLRGKWVLTEMLGAPPPPPPANVGVLPTDDKTKNGLTIRQQLEAHRAKAECAVCHARMDPIGFGLENFDPIGRFRTEFSGQKVDATGVLTSGEKFNGPKELKQVLVRKKDDILRNITERLLSYALGRGIENYDAWTVKGIVEAVKKDNYKGSTLVREIALSFPFRYRRGSDAKDPKDVK